MVGSQADCTLEDLLKKGAGVNENLLGEREVLEGFFEGEGAGIGGFGLGMREGVVGMVNASQELLAASFEILDSSRRDICCMPVEIDSSRNGLEEMMFIGAEAVELDQVECLLSIWCSWRLRCFCIVIVGFGVEETLGTGTLPLSGPLASTDDAGRPKFAEP